ncbi:acyl-CoA thioesterase [Rhodococcus chondri]|uniref:Thioesterase family protein n=1 Tax=Rhodococcus chondri TaxID=3065941 RepID=A0ABU7JQS2_9NOCA|nr:thioesterase family protein [Rhodococcus sp. CC-R104]MEE2032378.1 thioesterase family protein [Rhodococcus sp. CC-R104]
MPESESPAATHVFDEAIDLVFAGDNRFTGHTHAAYANMVGPFGGITAATILRAVEQHPDVLGIPLSLTINFAGPVAEGPFDIVARPVRTNRSTQHWSIELSQDGAVATTATAVFGTRRATWSSTEHPAPPVPPVEDVASQPFPDFVAWGRNYEMRFVEGAIPEPNAGEHPDSTTTLWVRDNPPRPLDFPALAALGDVFFPRIFLRRGHVLPAGTVTLTIYFHADAEALADQSDSAVLATARSHQFRNGYFDQSAHLWGSDGTALATSHQLVYFKA